MTRLTATSTFIALCLLGVAAGRPVRRRAIRVGAFSRSCQDYAALHKIAARKLFVNFFNNLGWSGGFWRIADIGVRFLAVSRPLRRSHLDRMVARDTCGLGIAQRRHGPGLLALARPDPGNVTDAVAFLTQPVPSHPIPVSRMAPGP